MYTLLLVLSIISYLTGLGLHIVLKDMNLWTHSTYISHAFLKLIPYFSGIGLALYPLYLLTSFPALSLLLVHSLLLLFIGPWITRFYIDFIASPQRPNFDFILLQSLGTICLTSSLFLKQ